MRRSICFAEPKAIAAGATGDWKFIYTPSQTLPKGTLLLFDILSKGRELDWEIPVPNSRSKKNTIQFLGTLQW
jgi:hypothetical protein